MSATDRSIVLVVDDDYLVASAIRRILERMGGFKVHMAFDGEAALARARDTTYAVIVLDIRLPGMDGIECAQRIRELGVQSPIVAVSGDANVLVAAREKIPAFAYMAKPLVARDFLAVILDAILQRAPAVPAFAV